MFYVRHGLFCIIYGTLNGVLDFDYHSIDSLFEYGQIKEQWLVQFGT